MDTDDRLSSPEAGPQHLWTPTSPLGRVIASAWANGWAMAALNVSNMETAQGVVAAAVRADAPVIVQISSGALAYAGYRTVTSLVRQVADDSSVPVFVHLDHCTDVAVAMRAVHDGYDSVMFDGSRLPYAENVRLTASVAAEAATHGVLSEGELGLIGGVRTTTIDEARAARTSPQEAALFVADTLIDVLAPALGTIHGMPDDAVSIDPMWIAAVARRAGRPIALHGGSGVAIAQLRPAIQSGVAKVNVSSRVSRALAAGIREAWLHDPDQLDLRRFMASGRDFVSALALEYFESTGSAGRADEARRLAWGDSPPQREARVAAPAGAVMTTTPEGEESC